LEYVTMKRRFTVCHKPLFGLLVLCCVLVKATSAAEATWAEQCRAALRSRALLVRCGALLALRDRTLEHPGEVLKVYRQESNGLTRRRMALVLGELSVRRELFRRQTIRRPELALPIAAFERELEAARDVMAASWGAEGGPRQATHTSERVQSSVAASSGRLSQRADELLDTLTLAGRQSEDQRELQLLRWTVDVALMDASVAPAEQHSTVEDRVQATQMLWLTDGRETPPLGTPQGYDHDANTPYLYALRSILAGGVRTWPDGGGAERNLALRPLAPLLRVSLHRVDLHPGLAGLYNRETLAKWGDATALPGLSLSGIDDSDGLYALTAATIRARLGRIEGVDELWGLRGKTPHDTLAILSRVLDLGVGPFPETGGDLDAWLSEADRQALKAWRERQSRFSRSIQDTDWQTLFALEGKARDAFARALQAAYLRERATLRYAPLTQRFYSPSHTRGNVDATLPPVHASLADLGVDDEAAKSWYRLCARRAFDCDMDVAVGATRALLWGEASLSEALARESRHLRRRQPVQAALLANLWHLVPTHRANVIRSAPDPVFTLLLRYLDTNDASTEFKLGTQIRQRLHPVLVPFLLVYAEQNPRLWSWLVFLQAEAARPFLLREVAREKTGSELYGPKRGQYSMGYFMDTFGALAFYHVQAALPALKRHSQNSWWSDAALAPLGELGGQEAVTFLRAHLEALQRPPSDPDRETEKSLTIIQLARNGEAAYLEQCVELLRSGHWGAPRQAANSLRACLPFDGPQFDNEHYDPPSDAAAHRVHAVWNRWLRDHRDRLHWNPNTSEKAA